MWRSRRSSRIASIRIWSPSGSAANATASPRFPTPGGPWKRYAWAAPSASAASRSAFASACSGTFSNMLENLLRDLVHRTVAAQRDDTLGEEPGELAVTVVHEGHEGVALALNPVAGSDRALDRLLDVDEEQEGDVREDSADRVEVQREHPLDPEAARDSLIDERRVQEPVGDDLGALGQLGADHLVDELGAGGREEGGLRPRGHPVAVEQEVAHALAERRPSGPARRNHRAPLVLERLGQELGLRRLARAVEALEGDEHGGRILRGPGEQSLRRWSSR